MNSCRSLGVVVFGAAPALILLLFGCAPYHTIPLAERNEVTAQADAVCRNIDAWCDDKITRKQSDYLLHEESRWERGEITQREYEREERRMLK